MKKIVLATLAAMALSSSVMALDLVDENENLIFRIGADLEGTQNDAENVILDSTGGMNCGDGDCGKIGKDKDMGYEISIAIEEKVNNNEFGARKTVTLYNFGDTDVHNGGLITHVENMGLEATYDVFYKVNKYFKPYVGAGAGINRQAIDYQERETTFGGGNFIDSKTLGGDRNKEDYQPTAHVEAGIDGEIFAGIGYYINAKYRFAQTTETIVPFNDGGVMTYKNVVNDGVSGTQYMAGVSYQF